MKTSYCLPYLSRRWSKPLILGLLSAAGFAVGFLPQTEGSQPLAIVAPAAAQSRPPIRSADVSNVEVTNYAKSVLETEPLRQKAYNDVKQIMGAQEVPPIVCFNEQSMRQLPAKARPIVERFCQRSQDIIERYFGTTEAGRRRYNDITIAISGDPPPDGNLHQRIENELIRLQKATQ